MVGPALYLPCAAPCIRSCGLKWCVQSTGATASTARLALPRTLHLAVQPTRTSCGESCEPEKHSLQ
jgi:hypothetical protein